MSSNVNKDIQNAIKCAKGNGKTNVIKGSATIPSPIILKHSLDQSDVNIPDPTKLQESVEE